MIKSEKVYVHLVIPQVLSTLYIAPPELLGILDTRQSPLLSYLTVNVGGIDPSNPWDGKKYLPKS